MGKFPLFFNYAASSYVTSHITLIIVPSLNSKFPSRSVWKDVFFKDIFPDLKTNFLCVLLGLGLDLSANRYFRAVVTEIWQIFLFWTSAIRVTLYLLFRCNFLKGFCKNYTRGTNLPSLWLSNLRHVSLLKAFFWSVVKQRVQSVCILYLSNPCLFVQTNCFTLNHMFL